MNTKTTEPIARRRKLATATTENKPTAELVSLAAQVMSLNTAANAAKNAYDKKRAELLRQMKDAGFRQFNASAIVNSKSVSFDAVIAAPSGTAISTEKLRKLVPDDVFMLCVSAAVGTVKEVAGAAVATQASVSTTGTENVSVKPSKG